MGKTQCEKSRVQCKTCVVRYKKKTFLSEGMCQCFGIARLFFRQTHLKADAQYNRKRGAHTDGVEGKKRKFLVVRVLLRPACGFPNVKNSAHVQVFTPRCKFKTKTSVVCCRCSLCAKVAAPAFNCNFWSHGLRLGRTKLGTWDSRIFSFWKWKKVAGLQIHFVEEFQPEQEVITNNHTNFFTSKKKTLHGVLFLSGKTTENKNKKHDHHFFFSPRARKRLSVVKKQLRSGWFCQ